MTDEIPELTTAQQARSLSASKRRRLLDGDIRSGDDVAAIRRFVGLTQVRFAQALGISVSTLRNWEQGRRSPEGAAIALLRIAVRHPRILRENLEQAAESDAAMGRAPATPRSTSPSSAAPPSPPSR